MGSQSTDTVTLLSVLFLRAARERRLAADLDDAIKTLTTNERRAVVARFGFPRPSVANPRVLARALVKLSRANRKTALQAVLARHRCAAL